MMHRVACVPTSICASPGLLDTRRGDKECGFRPGRFSPFFVVKSRLAVHQHFGVPLRYLTLVLFDFMPYYAKMYQKMPDFEFVYFCETLTTLFGFRLEWDFDILMSLAFDIFEHLTCRLMFPGVEVTFHFI